MSSFGYNVLGFGANASGGGDPVEDQFNRVSFLSHFDGANNGVNNSYDDGSASNHTITAAGNATQGSFGPFARPEGYWANHLDGTGDYISIADSADFNFTSAYTVEGWIFKTDTGYSYLMSQLQDNSTSASNFALVVVGSNLQVLLLQMQGSTQVVADGGAGSSGFTLNAWHHIAGSWDGSNMRLFVDGVLKATTSTSTAPNDGSCPLTIGCRTASGGSGGSEFTAGYISNARVVKNVAVYTSAFTPLTSPLTAISGTVLLTCQSNRFVDNSASAHTITPVADASVSSFGPFLTDEVYDPAVNGASAYFNDSSLQTPSSADFALGTGDFTIEWWVYQKAVYDYTIYFDIRTQNTQATPYLYQGDNGTFDYAPAGNTNQFTPPSLLNRWAHMAISRSSGTTKIFVDGVQYLSISDSINYVQGGTLHVSRWWSSNEYHVNGYMCDFRWVKGTAVYTSAFTPPTAPLTAITNTKLLLNMADGQAIDSAAQNNLSLIGTAKLSTGQAKFGDTSLFMDGNSDGVYIPAAPISTIWTVEQWIYPTRFYSGSGNYDRIWADGTANNDSLACVLWGNDDGNLGKIRLYNDDSLVVGTSTAVSLDTWTHLAIVSSGSTTKIFLDGTERGTTNSASNLKGRKFTIGYMGTSGYFGGYIDEFRTSLMARYTSNFTAPDEPFADKGQ